MCVVLVLKWAGPSPSVLSLILERYMYINCMCGSVAKASDTQAVGHGFEPRPDH